MIIVKLMGGLGNQMFQYAFGRYLAHQHDTVLKFDTQFLLDRTPRKGHTVFRNYDLDIFQVKADTASEKEVSRLSKRSRNLFLDKALNKLFGVKKSYILEPHFHFSENAFDSPDNIYLSGYWQSEKYFSPVRELIRQDFTYRYALSEPSKELLQSISAVESVCVNVRRADFVVNPFHGAYGVDYFQNASSLLEQKLTDPVYFVFSDDMEWCEANLRFNKKTVFVSHQYAGEKFQDYLRLMSACKHFIIPNSSFAWWAVWLNTSENRIVIAPRQWFADPSFDTKDLIPPSWIRI